MPILSGSCPKRRAGERTSHGIFYFYFILFPYPFSFLLFWVFRLSLVNRKHIVHARLFFFYSYTRRSNIYPFNDLPSKQHTPHASPWWSVYRFELYCHSTKHDANADGGCRHRVLVCARYLYDLEMDGSCGERQSGVISPAGWDNGTRLLIRRKGSGKMSEVKADQCGDGVSIQIYMRGTTPPSHFNLHNGSLSIT